MISMSGNTKLFGALSLKSKTVSLFSHERGNCPYAHNFQDYRRNPLEFKYKVKLSLFSHNDVLTGISKIRSNQSRNQDVRKV